MGDLYQHTQATQISNQLGQHSLDMNEARLNDWTSKTLLYTQKTGTDKANAKSDVYNEAEKDLPAVPIVAKTTATTLRAGRAFGVGAYRGVSQAEGVADSVKGVGRGFMGAYKTLDRAGTAAGSKIFGEGAVAVKDMTGVEGVVGKNLVEAGAGEAFSKVAAKSVAGAGFAIQAGGDAYNLFETGSIFNTKNSDGTITKGTTGEDIGNVAQLVTGGLDILAAFTGGALAPVAAAANIAAAGYNTYETAKADEATKTADSKNVPSKKPPPSVAPPAFAQLGIVSNQNHNPLARISSN
tara:strand:+ start:889 stop:1776 length:888 start_codon:yes stop_codon:yes gene_type:complete